MSFTAEIRKILDFCQSLLIQSELSVWRQETEKDSTKFIAICEELGATPAVDVLYEWCNWLTPPGTRVDDFSGFIFRRLHGQFQ